MALIIDLKPHEKFIVGDSLITNDKQKARLHIEGDTPILREKDILLNKDADTPCKKVYLTIELMYLAGEPNQDMNKIYFDLIKEIQNAAPSTIPFFVKINDFIMHDKYYKALKEAKKLVEYEEELIKNVGK